MAGITDRPFREIAERFGAGLVVSEMIASAALATGNGDMVRKLGKAGNAAACGATGRLRGRMDGAGRQDRP